MGLHTEIHTTLETLDKAQWNAFNPQLNPFVRYEFLIALERNGCLGKRMGWFPRYFVIKDEQGELLAAAPCYIKHNSHGEFVFDWAWADAYHRTGREYYPKLVCAAPFTPVQGPRFLTHPSLDAPRLQQRLLDSILQYCEEQQLSSFHCLFPQADHRDFFEQSNTLQRIDHQYHWQNQNHRDFEDFLSGFKARKRKETKRERRIVAEQGIRTRIFHGNELSDEQCQQAHRFYQLTFQEKGNTPALTLDFFREVMKTMGEQMVVVFAYKDDVGEEPIAGAINFRDKETLYGRYWGCDYEYPCLHFEVCFYRGIEYCIEHGLQRFEPGAQGEHKITRGFLPVQTYSQHWIADEGFQAPIADYLERERLAILDYADSLWEKSPFKDQPNRPQ